MNHSYCRCIFLLLWTLCIHVFAFTGSANHQLNVSTRKYSKAVLPLQSIVSVSTVLRLRGGSDHMSNLPTTTSTTGTLLSASPVPLGSTTLQSAMRMLPLSWITTTLKSGPYGVLALTAIAATICIPVTQWKHYYGISVGYGFSVAAMAITIRHIFPCAVVPFTVPDVITSAALFYGLRLAVFLFVRDVSGRKPLVAESTTAVGRRQRVPFAMSLSLFYACLMTPVLYALRTDPILVPTSWKVYTAWMGCALAWLGAIMETIADTQKFMVKSRSHSTTAFRGPCQGLYAWTRHPNYTGEILFWCGIWLTGLPSFDTSVIAWLCSSAGLYGIITIMRGATHSLEKRQADKYGGQPKYETWKKDVPSPLIPYF
jgi:steroid 5-alpha reductase family enzyme